jgi:hypothetical protein
MWKSLWSRLITTYLCVFFCLPPQVWAQTPPLPPQEKGANHQAEEPAKTKGAGPGKAQRKASPKAKEKGAPAKTQTEPAKPQPAEPVPTSGRIKDVPPSKPTEIPKLAPEVRAELRKTYSRTKVREAMHMTTWVFSQAVQAQMAGILHYRAADQYYLFDPYWSGCKENPLGKDPKEITVEDLNLELDRAQTMVAGLLDSHSDEIGLVTYSLNSSRKAKNEIITSSVTQAKCQPTTWQPEFYDDSGKTPEAIFEAEKHLKEETRGFLEPPFVELSKVEDEDPLSDTEISVWINWIHALRKYRSLMAQHKFNRSGLPKRQEKGKAVAMGKAEVEANREKILPGPEFIVGADAGIKLTHLDQLTLVKDVREKIKARRTELALHRKEVMPHFYWSVKKETECPMSTSVGAGGRPTGSDYCYCDGKEVSDRLMDEETALLLQTDSDNEPSVKVGDPKPLNPHVTPPWAVAEAHRRVALNALTMTAATGNSTLPLALRRDLPEACQKEGNITTLYRETTDLSEQRVWLTHFTHAVEKMAMEFRQGARIAPIPSQEVFQNFYIRAQSIAQDAVEKYFLARASFTQDGAKLAEAKRKVETMMKALPFKDRIFDGDQLSGQDFAAFFATRLQTHVYFTQGDLNRFKNERETLVADMIQEVLTYAMVDALEFYALSFFHGLGDVAPIETFQAFFGQTHKRVFEAFLFDDSQRADAIVPSFFAAWAKDLTTQLLNDEELKKPYDYEQEAYQRSLTRARDLKPYVRQAQRANQLVSYMGYQKKQKMTPHALLKMDRAHRDQGAVTDTAKGAACFATQDPFRRDGQYPFFAMDPAFDMDKARQEIATNHYGILQRAFPDMITERAEDFRDLLLKEITNEQVAQRYRYKRKDKNGQDEIVGPESVSEVAQETIAKVVEYIGSNPGEGANPGLDLAASQKARKDALTPLERWLTGEAERLEKPGQQRTEYYDHAKIFASRLYANYLEPLLAKRETQGGKPWDTLFKNRLKYLVDREIYLEAPAKDPIIEFYRDYHREEKEIEEIKNILSLLSDSSKPFVQAKSMETSENWLKFCQQLDRSKEGPKCISWVEETFKLYQNSMLPQYFEGRMLAVALNRLRGFFLKYGQKGETYRGDETLKEEAEKAKAAMTEAEAQKDPAQKKLAVDAAKILVTQADQTRTSIHSMKEALLSAWYGYSVQNTPYRAERAPPQQKEVYEAIDAFLKQISREAHEPENGRLFHGNIEERIKALLQEENKKLSLYKNWKTRIEEEIAIVVNAVKSGNPDLVRITFLTAQILLRSETDLLRGGAQAVVNEQSKKHTDEELARLLLPSFDTFNTKISDWIAEAKKDFKDPATEIGEIEKGLAQINDELYLLDKSHEWGVTNAIGGLISYTVGTAAYLLGSDKTPGHEEAEQRRRLGESAARLNTRREEVRGRLTQLTQLRRVIRNYLGPDQPTNTQATPEAKKAIAELEKLDFSNFWEAYYQDEFVNTSTDAESNPILIDDRPVTAGQMLEDFNSLAQDIKAVLKTDPNRVREHLEDLEAYCKNGIEDVQQAEKASTASSFESAYRDTLMAEITSLVPKKAELIVLATNPNNREDYLEATRITLDRVKRIWNLGKRSDEESRLNFTQWVKSYFPPRFEKFRQGWNELKTREAEIAQGNPADRKKEVPELTRKLLLNHVKWEDLKFPSSAEFCGVINSRIEKLRARLEENKEAIAARGRLTTDLAVEYWEGIVQPASDLIHNPHSRFDRRFLTDGKGTVVKTLWFRHAPTDDIPEHLASVAVPWAKVKLELAPATQPLPTEAAHAEAQRAEAVVQFLSLPTLKKITVRGLVQGIENASAGFKALVSSDADERLRALNRLTGSEREQLYHAIRVYFMKQLQNPVQVAKAEERTGQATGTHAGAGRSAAGATGRTQGGQAAGNQGTAAAETKDEKGDDNSDGEGDRTQAATAQTQSGATGANPPQATLPGPSAGNSPNAPPNETGAVAPPPAENQAPREPQLRQSERVSQRPGRRGNLPGAGEEAPEVTLPSGTPAPAGPVATSPPGPAPRPSKTVPAPVGTIVFQPMLANPSATAPVKTVVPDMRTPRPSPGPVAPTRPPRSSLPSIGDEMGDELYEPQGPLFTEQTVDPSADQWREELKRYLTIWDQRRTDSNFVNAFNATTASAAFQHLGTAIVLLWVSNTKYVIHAPTPKTDQNSDASKALSSGPSVYVYYQGDRRNEIAARPFQDPQASLTEYESYPVPQKMQVIDDIRNLYNAASGRKVIHKRTEQEESVARRKIMGIKTDPNLRPVTPEGKPFSLADVTDLRQAGFEEKFVQRPHKQSPEARLFLFFSKYFLPEAPPDVRLSENLRGVAEGVAKSGQVNEHAQELLQTVPELETTIEEWRTYYRERTSEGKLAYVRDLNRFELKWEPQGNESHQLPAFNDWLDSLEVDPDAPRISGLTSTVEMLFKLRCERHEYDVRPHVWDAKDCSSFKDFKTTKNGAFQKFQGLIARSDLNAKATGEMGTYGALLALIAWNRHHHNVPTKFGPADGSRGPEDEIPAPLFDAEKVHYVDKLIAMMKWNIKDFTSWSELLNRYSDEEHWIKMGSHKLAMMAGSPTTLILGHRVDATVVGSKSSLDWHALRPTPVDEGERVQFLPAAADGKLSLELTPETRRNYLRKRLENPAHVYMDYRSSQGDPKQYALYDRMAITMGSMVGEWHLQAGNPTERPVFDWSSVETHRFGLRRVQQTSEVNGKAVTKDIPLRLSRVDADDSDKQVSFWSSPGGQARLEEILKELKVAGVIYGGKPVERGELLEVLPVREAYLDIKEGLDQLRKKNHFEGGRIDWPGNGLVESGLLKFARQLGSQKTPNLLPGLKNSDGPLPSIQSAEFQNFLKEWGGPVPPVQSEEFRTFINEYKLLNAQLFVDEVAAEAVFQKLPSEKALYRKRILSVVDNFYSDHVMAYDYLSGVVRGRDKVLERMAYLCDEKRDYSGAVDLEQAMKKITSESEEINYDAIQEYVATFVPEKTENPTLRLLKDRKAEKSAKRIALDNWLGPASWGLIGVAVLAGTVAQPGMMGKWAWLGLGANAAVTAIFAYEIYDGLHDQFLVKPAEIERLSGIRDAYIEKGLGLVSSNTAFQIDQSRRENEETQASFWTGGYSFWYQVWMVGMTTSMALPLVREFYSNAGGVARFFDSTAYAARQGVRTLTKFKIWNQSVLKEEPRYAIKKLNDALKRIDALKKVRWWEKGEPYAALNFSGSEASKEILKIRTDLAASQTEAVSEALRATEFGGQHYLNSRADADTLIGLINTLIRKGGLPESEILLLERAREQLSSIEPFISDELAAVLLAGRGNVSRIYENIWIGFFGVPAELLGLFSPEIRYLNGISVVTGREFPDRAMIGLRLLHNWKTNRRVRLLEMKKSMDALTEAEYLAQKKATGQAAQELFSSYLPNFEKAMYGPRYGELSPEERKKMSVLMAMLAPPKRHPGTRRFFREHAADKIEDHPTGTNVMMMEQVPTEGIAQAERYVMEKADRDLATELVQIFNLANLPRDPFDPDFFRVARALANDDWRDLAHYLTRNMAVRGTSGVLLSEEEQRERKRIAAQKGSLPEQNVAEAAPQTPAATPTAITSPAVGEDGLTLTVEVNGKAVVIADPIGKNALSWSSRQLGALEEEVTQVIKAEHKLDRAVDSTFFEQNIGLYDARASWLDRRWNSDTRAAWAAASAVHRAVEATRHLATDFAGAGKALSEDKIKALYERLFETYFSAREEMTIPRAKGVLSAATDSGVIGMKQVQADWPRLGDGPNVSNAKELLKKRGINPGWVDDAVILLMANAQEKAGSRVLNTLKFMTQAFRQPMRVLIHPEVIQSLGFSESGLIGSGKWLGMGTEGPRSVGERLVAIFNFREAVNLKSARVILGIEERQAGARSQVALIHERADALVNDLKTLPNLAAVKRVEQARQLALEAEASGGALPVSAGSKAPIPAPAQGPAASVPPPGQSGAEAAEKKIAGRVMSRSDTTSTKAIAEARDLRASQSIENATRLSNGLAAQDAGQSAHSLMELILAQLNQTYVGSTRFPVTFEMAKPLLEKFIKERMRKMPQAHWEESAEYVYKQLAEGLRKEALLVVQKATQGSLANPVSAEQMEILWEAFESVRLRLPEFRTRDGLVLHAPGLGAALKSAHFDVPLVSLGGMESKIAERILRGPHQDPHTVEKFLAVLGKEDPTAWPFLASEQEEMVRIAWELNTMEGNLNREITQVEDLIKGYEGSPEGSGGHQTYLAAVARKQEIVAIREWVDRAHHRILREAETLPIKERMPLRVPTPEEQAEEAAKAAAKAQAPAQEPPAEP